MMTVNEVSKLTGVSIRTLQYYDKIGLLKASKYTETGYRLYDDIAPEKLQQILLFRELEFPLKEIKRIVENPDFDKSKALEQQITLLTLKKEHLENLIDLAREIKLTGVNDLKNFEAFDTSKLDEYAEQAKASWGNTPAYKEFEQKSKVRTPEEEKNLGVQMMEIFAEVGKMKDQDPSSAQAQVLVDKLQVFITEHYYHCSDEMLSKLGKMYAGGGDFTKNIDNYSGAGTAEFANQAIQIHCNK